MPEEGVRSPWNWSYGVGSRDQTQGPLQEEQELLTGELKGKFFIWILVTMSLGEANIMV